MCVSATSSSVLDGCVSALTCLRQSVHVSKASITSTTSWTCSWQYRRQWRVTTTRRVTARDVSENKWCKVCSNSRRRRQPQRRQDTRGIDVPGVEAYIRIPSVTRLPFSSMYAIWGLTTVQNIVTVQHYALIIANGEWGDSVQDTEGVLRAERYVLVWNKLRAVRVSRG